MYINSQTLSNHFIINQLFILILAFNIISCKCNNKGSGKNYLGNVTTEVTPLQLDQTNNSFSITFQLSEPGKKVDLTNFKLKANIIKEEVGTGSELSYQDATGNSKQTSELEEPLTHFTSLLSLEDTNRSFKIDFKVIPSKDVSLLIYQIEAFDSEGNSIGSYLVKYKSTKKLPILTLKSAEEIQGDDKEIKLKVHNPSSKAIPANTLKLQVTRTTGKEAIIVGATTTDKYEIIINEAIPAHRSLTKTLIIDPKADLSAIFSISLVDQEGRQSGFRTITWQGGEIRIKHLNPFVGNNEATFSLYNTAADIQHDQLTIELASDNEAAFTLIKQDNSDGGTSLILKDLIAGSNTDANHKTAPIRFRLLNENGKDKALITVHVKRGPTLLACQAVTWKTAGNNLKVRSKDELDLFKDQKSYTIHIENRGEVINSDKIKFKFINSQNIAFKIGSLSADTTFETSLTDIIGQPQLAEKEIREFTIQQDGTSIPDLYGAELGIELLDETGTILGKIDLEWENETKNKLELKPLFDMGQNLKEEFSEHANEAENELDGDGWTTAMKALLQVKDQLIELISKLTTIKLSNAPINLQQHITKYIGFNKRLLQEMDETIIEFLAKEVAIGIKIYMDTAENYIQELESITGDAIKREATIISLDKELQEIDEALARISEIATIYNTSEAQDIINEAKELIGQLQEAAKKAKGINNLNDGYIDQINNAASIVDALKIVNEIHKTAISAPDYRKAIHAYQIVAEKAYSASDRWNISWNDIKTILEGTKGIFYMLQDKEESTDQMAITLGYSILLIKKEIEKEGTNSNPYALATKRRNIKANFSYMKTLALKTEESKKIYKEAQKALVDLGIEEII